MSNPVRSAKILLERLFLENPLLHPDIWPVNFTTGRISNTDWVEVSFGDLEENDVIGFPKIDRDLINPVALDLTSGPHALQQGDSLLTYMNQILLKGRDLTREQTEQALQTFPFDWKLQFMDIRAPAEFQPSDNMPRWIPIWWDDARFGTWHDLIL